MGLAFALGVAIFTAPSAAAAETAYNQKTQFLTADPNAGMVESCMDRRIFLRDGVYDWGQRMGGDRRVPRPDMILGNSWYTWKDCLVPRNGHYTHFTSLDPDTPGWSTANMRGDWDLGSSRDYTWGSYLDPQD
jgi:hypothetical protein